ncbi:MAG: hypothetical protein HY709_10055, partial [Candidatus Latescibacteria bacterium]|nr:hypothetical protein [Candidatus Latescibacterota bacterium]
DLYVLFKDVPQLTIDDVYAEAKRKEAMLDDPPTVAYQIEEGLRFLKEHRDLMPPLKRVVDMQDFVTFYEELVRKFYRKLSP